VYNDLNNNNDYDYGEGIANTQVALDGVSKSTNAGGGYSFEVRDSGDHTLGFVESNKSLPISIQAGSPNLKVDLIDGNTLVINRGLGPL
ncbi:MAG: hypothetical protein ACREJC_08925, partial [Tepidisphaeraceae bacterium]